MAQLPEGLGGAEPMAAIPPAERPKQRGGPAPPTSSPTFPAYELRYLTSR